MPTEAHHAYVTLCHHKGRLLIPCQISNMSPQSTLWMALQRHSILVKVSCFSWLRPFVSKSVGCSFVGRYSTSISPLSVFSLRKWCCMSTCLVLSWNSGL